MVVATTTAFSNNNDGGNGRSIPLSPPYPFCLSQPVRFSIGFQSRPKDLSWVSKKCKSSPNPSSSPKAVCSYSSSGLSMSLASIASLSLHWCLCNTIDQQLHLQPSIRIATRVLSLNVGLLCTTMIGPSTPTILEMMTRIDFGGLSSPMW